jgi:hypothetical protein
VPGRNLFLEASLDRVRKTGHYRYGD